jgi:hypothetical protein
MTLFLFTKLDLKETYTHLGIEDSHDVEHKNEKEKLKNEYFRTLRLVMGTEKSTKNKIQVIGSLAVPVLRFSFGIFNLRQEEVQKLDRKTTELPTIYGQHYPKADIVHWYVTRKQGGRDLMQLEGA